MNYNMKMEKLVFEISQKGRAAYSLPCCDVPEKGLENYIPKEYLRESPPELPEVSEVDVVRHYTRLSQMNYGVDSGFYPLGSCTMKYNPKVNEKVSNLTGFKRIHPYQDEGTVQGCLQLMYEMDKMLCEITGMDRFSLQPSAGAHAEVTGLMMIKAYHDYNRQTQRNKIIVPDSAHGTNPASAAMVGLEVVEVKSDDRGNVDINDLKKLIGKDTAGFMLTNPNTLGLFEKNIAEIADIVHSSGGLLYYDGANANAILGITTPGHMGFDIVHLNLHKTFSAPHGGGGPGSGPIGVKKELAPFLPVPMVEFKDDSYYLEYNRPLSIGKVKSFYGNFSVVVKAYAYLMSMGFEGLKSVSETAVLNANYLMRKLKKYFDIPYESTCMHEFVISGERQKQLGVTTYDIAKRLLDFGIHPPTVYFPLIVKEAMMIEPTETEGKETLDEFVGVLAKIAEEAEREPEKLKHSPSNTPVGRLDEAKAARSSVLRWKSNF